MYFDYHSQLVQVLCVCFKAVVSVPFWNQNILWRGYDVQVQWRDVLHACSLHSVPYCSSGGHLCKYVIMTFDVLHQEVKPWKMNLPPLIFKSTWCDGWRCKDCGTIFNERFLWLVNTSQTMEFTRGKPFCWMDAIWHRLYYTTWTNVSLSWQSFPIWSPCARVFVHPRFPDSLLCAFVLWCLSRRSLRRPGIHRWSVLHLVC